MHKALITSFLAFCKIFYGCIPPVLHYVLKEINFLRMKIIVLSVLHVILLAAFNDWYICVTSLFI